MRRVQALALALLGTFTALVVHSLTYSGFFEDPFTWGIVGLAAACLALAPRPAPSPSPTRAAGGAASREASA